MKLPRRHGQPLRVVEVRHVHPERAVLLHVDQVVENHVAVFRLAVRSEPHDLVLPLIDLEAGVVVDTEAGMGT